GMPTTERAAGCRCRILLSDTTRCRDASRCVEPTGEMVSRDGIEPSTRILRAVLENYIQIGEPPARCRFPPPYSHPHHRAELGTVGFEPIENAHVPAQAEVPHPHVEVGPRLLGRVDL